MIRFSILLALFFYFVPNVLFSDTVYLKSGDTIENVKSKIGNRFLKIDNENGNVSYIPLSKCKTVKIQPVLWQTKRSAPSFEAEESARVEEFSEKGDTFTPRPEEDKISPVSNFFLGLIPGYSGLYRTKNYWGGATFSILELAAVANLVSLSSQQGLSGGVFQGSSKTTSSSENTQKTQFGEAALGLVLFTDAIISSIMASAWNEGSYSGEPIRYGPKKTTAWSRGARSFLFPGWGQIYAQNSYRGSAFLSSGLALFAAGIYAENETKTDRRDYNEAKDHVYNSRYSLVLYTNPPVIVPATNSTALYLSALKAEGSRDHLDQTKSDREKIWTAFAAVWTISLIDSLFFAGEPSEAKNGFRFHFDVKPISQIGTLQSNIGANQLEYSASLKYLF